MVRVRTGKVRTFRKVTEVDVRFPPIADIGRVCEPLLMNARGFLFVFVVVACLLALMFYSAMFMHGDPVEQP